MRPSRLDPLFAPVGSLPGIGPKMAAALDRLVGEPDRPARVVDLLLHVPTGFVSHRVQGRVADAPCGEPVSVLVKVAEHRPAPPGRGRAPTRVLVEDDSGDITLVFFGWPAARVHQALPLGSRKLISGTIELYDGRRQMVHPSRILDERQADAAPGAEPVYGLTEGVTSRLVAKAVDAALKRVPELPEWQDEAWLSRSGFPGFHAALETLHHPVPQAEAVGTAGPRGTPDGGAPLEASLRSAPGSLAGQAAFLPPHAEVLASGEPRSTHDGGASFEAPLRGAPQDEDRGRAEEGGGWRDGLARRRLAYDELLASQLALALIRARSRRAGGRGNAGDGRLVERITAALPFPMTGAQRRALAEIRGDLGAESRMLRLLQGDVGSGKTLVALLAMASAAEAGRQSALVAPTEILARQHAERIAAMAGPAGLAVAVVTGRDSAARRRAVLADLVAGRVDIAVGTHALFGEEVAFGDLGLVVIDEQHRFGVHQRLALTRKGRGVDVLVMTATPIPRTLALSAFGDMDISVLDEKPPGRKPVDTRLVSAERLHQVVGAVARAIAAGDLVYWVCPLVEESETRDVAAAEERSTALAAELGQDVVGLVHGRLPARDKDLAMQRFARGDLKVLVSTTVIEVGVDVPRASVMVVEHAERFGLAQLHQLRGRVGRGERPSTCLLVYKGPLGATAKARLETLRRTEDGFEIAEEDLRLRGEGEILGTRQSGQAEFRVARLDLDGDLLAVARDDARLILERDPDLRGPRGEALRALLYLFGRDAGVRMLAAG